MQLDKKTKIGIWLFTIPAVTFFLLESRGAYHHWAELSGIWDKHAMFHAVTGLFYTQIICISVVVLAWIPLRRGGEMWCWFILMLMGVGMHGGHVIGDPLTDHGLSGARAGGGSGEMFYYGTIAALGFYVVALILTHRHAKGGG